MTELPSGRHWIPDTRHLLGREERLERLLQGDTREPPGDMPLYQSTPQPPPGVALIQARTAADSRWHSMGLSTGALYLGAGLARAGIPFQIHEPVLPALRPDYPPPQVPIWGITLFEDLFLELRDWLLAAPPCSCVAVGGPAATLHPLAVFTHLGGVDLLLRGEGEVLFPRILKALYGGHVRDLDGMGGLLLNLPDGLLCLDLDQPHRPDPIRLPLSDGIPFEPERFRSGLELNVSRGCRRACAFCAKVQGPRYRKLDLSDLDRFLQQHAGRVAQAPWSRDPQARSVNLNDDDLLQEPAYALEVLDLLQKHDLGIWGLQTSPLSLLSRNRPNESLLTVLARSERYISGKPLLWLGTDVFLQNRARRLHKGLPDDEALHALLRALDDHGFAHHHYWILSDHDSTWPEFCREALRIMALMNRFPGMGLLPHAPLIIPYPGTPLHTHLMKTEPQRVRLRQRFPGTSPLTRMDLATPLPTREEGLNRLLADAGFRDALRERDHHTALLALYRGLQDCRLLGHLEQEGQAILEHITGLLEEDRLPDWDTPLLRENHPGASVDGNTATP